VTPQRGRLFLPVVLLAVAVSLSPGPLRAEQFLIVEHPAALVIYDRYQRLLGSKDAEALGSNVPMRILERHSLLGDGLTPCMSVEIAGTPFYILTESGGRIAQRSGTGGWEEFDNAVALQDTVTVLRSARLGLLSPGELNASLLDTGERVARVFRIGERAYVRRMAPQLAYGWVTFPQRDRGRSWDLATACESVPARVTPGITDSVRASLRRVNEVIANLFTSFNRNSPSRLAPPHWELRAAGGALRCTLENAADLAAFQESSSLLARDLERFTLGTGLAVTESPGQIIIRPK